MVKTALPVSHSSPNRQIRSLVLSVDLVGSRPIWPAHVGGLVDPDGSRRIVLTINRMSKQSRRTGSNAGWEAALLGPQGGPAFAGDTSLFQFSDYCGLFSQRYSSCE